MVTAGEGWSGGTSNALPSGCVFFGSHAHGSGDLPLAEEIDLHSGTGRSGRDVVDDFAVPDDPGYSFDDYGAGKALTLGYLIANDVLPAGVWFPRCGSSAETGARRGCVVLAQAADVVRRIDALTTLHRWQATRRTAPKRPSRARARHDYLPTPSGRSPTDGGAKNLRRCCR